MAEVLLDPITRIEGHLSIKLDVQNGKVVDAWSRGDMYRGLERILRGRNPMDAIQITQRICGVCPVSHGQAAAKACDAAFGIKPNANGRILRNLTLAANYLQSHILHFYHLGALDFVDITAILKYEGSDSGLLNIKAWAQDELKNNKFAPVSPFLPRYEGKDFYIKDVATNIDAIAGYVKALDARMKAHKMVALIGGRVPHVIGTVPGGMTQVPTRDKIKQFRKYLKEVKKFVNDVYTSHVLAVARNAQFKDYYKLGKFTNLLSYGVFEQDNDYKKFTFNRGVYVDGKIEAFDSAKIREQVRYARYNSGSNLHPLKGDTNADPNKGGAYTWLKAPRYDGKAMEVGVLPRIVMSYASKDGNPMVKTAVDGLLKELGIQVGDVFSVLGRHACRLIESKILCEDMEQWCDELEMGAKPRTTFEIPQTGEGEGLIEAARGALGHWLVVKDQKIENYQAIVPTTWFCGPRDDNGVRGPVEQALLGTPISDPKNPIEAARIVRSFDPCIACAVHVVEGDKEIGEFRIS